MFTTGKTTLHRVHQYFHLTWILVNHISQQLMFNVQLHVSSATEYKAQLTSGIWVQDTPTIRQILVRAMPDLLYDMQQV